MKQTDIPTTFPTPFAASGTKNTIPVPSQTATDPGLASFTDGFPPATFTDVAAGGVPPYGADFNGILNMLSAAIRWNDAGGCYPYDSTFSTAIGGYPKGAVVLNDSGDGFWQSTADDNTTDPASDTTGKWMPLSVPGSASIALSGSNVTLTPDQYQRRTLTLTGTLTVNAQVTLPTIANLQWQVINNTSGAYTVTVKTASGTGVSCPQSGSTTVYCDGVNIGRLNAFATNTQSLAGTATNVAANPAGVAAFVGQSGLGKSALQYLPGAGNVSLDDYYIDGHYRFQEATYSAAGGTQSLANFSDGQLIVINASGQDTTLQIISGYENGEVMWRSFINANGGNPNAASHPFKVVWDSNNFNPADYITTASAYANYHQAFTPTNIGYSLSSVHTNTTGRPITVFVTAHGNAGQAPNRLTAYIDGVNFYSTGSFGQPSPVGISFTVPAGSTYEVAGSNVVIERWYEQ